jgi:hypothetical protein
MRANEDLVNLLDELAEKKEKLAQSLETIEKLKNEAQMNNSPHSSLNWDKEDMSATFESVLERFLADKRINQEMHDKMQAKLTDERLEALLHQFFNDTNEWLVNVISNDMYAWAIHVLEEDEL